MPKQATMIVLSEPERDGLLQITKRHRSEKQVMLRARIVLAAAQGSSNTQNLWFVGSLAWKESSQRP